MTCFKVYVYVYGIFIMCCKNDNAPIALPFLCTSLLICFDAVQIPEICNHWSEAISIVFDSHRSQQHSFTPHHTTKFGISVVEHSTRLIIQPDWTQPFSTLAPSIQQPYCTILEQTCFINTLFLVQLYVVFPLCGVFTNHIYDHICHV